MTLNDIMAVTLRYCATLASEGNCVKSAEGRPVLSATDI